MGKNYTNRRVTVYGDVTVQIDIAVYGYGNLTTPELTKAGDQLADDAMQSIHNAPGCGHPPLSRIKAERRRQ